MKWSRVPAQSNLDESSYGIKSTLAQVLALLTTYLFNIKLGIDQMIPTIIIGANKHYINGNSLSKITEEQETWIGSLLYLFPPVGSLIASLVQDCLGHRKCLMLANVVHLLSVIILLNTDTLEILYIVTILMGFNMGFVGSVTISYCGEVSDPKLRGLLTSAISLFYLTGCLIIIALYEITTDWKRSVLFTVAIPVVNTVFLFQTPNSPMWLLSKGRISEAKQTLKKLRGNASEENFTKEFQDMIHYTSTTNCNDTPTGNTKYASLVDSFYYLIKPETMKPFQMLVIITFFTNVLSGQQFNPFLKDVFQFLNVSNTVIHDWAMTIYTGCAVLGNMLTVIVINRLGKRILSLSTMASCLMCYMCIGVIGHFWPLSTWLKLVLFYLSAFFSSMGILPVMWTLFSELYPMKTKNLGTSLSTATYYIMCFLLTKFYKNFETAVGFNNAFVIFGVLGVIGFAYLYYQLPETENKSLDEISLMFKRKSTNKYRNQNQIIDDDFDT